MAVWFVLLLHVGQWVSHTISTSPLTSFATSLLLAALSLAIQIILGHRHYEGHDNFANLVQGAVAFAYFGPTFEAAIWKYIDPKTYSDITREAKNDCEVFLKKYQGVSPNESVHKFLKSN
eukprot:TRINITY_DN876_c0_g1_i3.p1 TRINITY_DN876_c0_g1~~TRINITY_DN876_c0_g1_i3.p1  ORF type:complete len:120 (+),score=30.84 TRINITY_DN876_c0_g1_i3:360-719(+)